METANGIERSQQDIRAVLDKFSGHSIQRAKGSIESHLIFVQILDSLSSNPTTHYILNRTINIKGPSEYNTEICKDHLQE